jgi:glutamate racemase
MPGEDIVYLGDSARVPYGIKSLETVRRFALQDAAFLSRFSPKLIVVACNTASAAAFEVLQQRLSVGVVDVIRPGAAAALGATDGLVGVIGTEATIGSQAYQRALREGDPNREVFAAACPLLVPIVEEGRDVNDPIVLHVLGDYLRDLQRRRPGALILGCTHYPLLAAPIGKLMGPSVALVSPARAAAEKARDELDAAGLLSDAQRRGELRCYTTDNPRRFGELALRFGGRECDSVEYVGTDELTELVPAEDRDGSKS